MLSERAKQLIPQARIFGISEIQSQYPESVVAIFQNADDNGRYLSDRDLKILQENCPELEENIQVSQILRDSATEIVDHARKEVLNQFPQITEEGGELYPAFRAEACWRDFWHFLRTISYGVAAQIEDFTSSEGLKNMELLYQELKVPLPAMLVGLENLKVYSLPKFSTAQQKEIAVYFDHLITQMRKLVS